MRETFLVTGGAGFIGSHIAEALVKKGKSVIVLDNFVTGNPENLRHIRSDLRLIRGDIRNLPLLKRALRGVNYVLHQAALRSVPRSVENPSDSNEVNVTGTLNVLLAAKSNGVKRVVYASSSSIYGDNPTLPKREDQKPSPVSPYAVSKLSGELYSRVFSKIFGVETVSLRYFNVFGPRQDPRSKYAAVVPLFMRQALRGEPLTIHGDGKQSRDFTYIDNVVEANLLALKARRANGEVFNVACGERFSLLQMAGLIERLLKKRLRRIHAASRAGDVRHTLADISRARRLLNWRPSVSFEEGIRRTLSYLEGRL